jgi:hypothetical protein
VTQLVAHGDAANLPVVGVEGAVTGHCAAIHMVEVIEAMPSVAMARLHVGQIAKATRPQEFPAHIPPVAAQVALQVSGF